MFSAFSSSSVKEETGYHEDVLLEIYGRNFIGINPHHVYLVYKYIHLYPKNRQASTVLGVSTTTFKRIFYTTAEIMAQRINELDYDLRLSPFNHCIHFPTRVTAMVDTFVIHVSNPVEYRLAKTLYNPKYSGFVLKWQIIVDFLGNYLYMSGPHVLYDGHIFTNTIDQHAMFHWELVLGDGHYIGLDHVLAPFKRDHPLSNAELIYNTIHSFYRSRVEHAIRRIKNHLMFNSVFRGSWDVLEWSIKISVHTTQMENRFRPKYAYVGTWLHYQ